MMSLLKLISRYWLGVIGILAIIELVNRFSYDSNSILIAAAVMAVIGLTTSIAVPKSG